MMKKITISIAFCFVISALFAQNYVENGDFEYGLNANWTHQVASGGTGEFSLSQDEFVMEGSVGLKVQVQESTYSYKAIKSTTSFTAGADSLYLLRFWARGYERSEIYVEVEGSETPGVLYEVHSGRTFFHLPFKTAPYSELKINFYFKDDRTSYQNKHPELANAFSSNKMTYHLDGVEVLDQDNKENIDVLNTYIWQHNRVGQGWTAGDNDVSCLLPDGRTVWFFNDSFYGTNDASNNPLYDVGQFVRNAVVVQELDGTLNTMPAKEQSGGGGQTVFFEIPQSDIILNDDGKVKNCFWVGDALVENDMLKVYLIEVYGEGRSYIGRFSYPELEYLGTVQQPSSCTRYETFFVEDQTIYLFDWDDIGLWEQRSHVARTSLGNIEGSEPWEYWNGTEWGTDPEEVAYINDMRADGVIRLEEGNYVMTTIPNMSRQVQVSFAENPIGPWTDPQTVYTMPEDSAYWFYMPNIHNQLPNGNYSISYSVNANYDLFFAFESFVDKYWYRQRYIQVELLGLSPFTEKEDCAGVLNGSAYLDECDHCVGGTTGLEPCATGIAKLYSDCDYTGSIIGLNVGDYSIADLQALGFSDNELSSIEVEDGYLVELFDEDQFSGDNLLINSSFACLSDENFDNKATSLIVRRNKESDLSGVFAIQNKQSELYMSVANSSNENYAVIDQNSYEDESQEFEFEELGNGYYKISNVASGLALNVIEASEDPKANIEQWDGLEFDLTDVGGSISVQYDDSPAAEKMANLIDNNSNTKYLTFNNHAWIQFQATTPKVVNGYSLTSANDADTRDPKNWSLRGSNDGEEWVLLDTLSNIDFPTRFEEKYFSIENSTAYSYYRLDMEADFGDVLQLAEWKLFVTPESGEEVTSQVFFVQDAGDGYYRIINKNSDLLLEIIDGDKTEGTKVRQMNDIGQPGALWKLVDPDDIATSNGFIQDELKQSEIVLYPNPVKNTLNLKVTSDLIGAKVVVYNLNGILVFAGNINQSSIDVSKLQTGFYTIKVSNNSEVFVSSFLKQ
ncbi:RICIN domain-containing protein [Sunxiuqinia sp. A32]|uniref:RICIN domain-containing protein n=1 Tax=Sunxiuqinia sp. A32 TaxID=3461496 RepID=UPI0040467963